MFPAIIDALKELRQGFGYQPVTLDLKSTVGSFDTTTDLNWYLRNGFQTIYQQLGGSLSNSGIAVTGDKALESSAVYACTKIIAEDMGTLPFVTYRRNDKRATVEKATDHPLFATLKNLVNPEISSGEFVEALTAHALICGNGYAQIQRKGDSVFLWPWQPADVRMDTAQNGRLFYIHRENGQDKSYARRDVFHLRGFTFDGVSGDDMMRRARHAIGLALAAQEFAAEYFANDASPGVVITRPKEAAKLTPEQVEMFHKKWNETHQKNSGGGSHLLGLLQEGMDIKSIVPNAANAQLIEQRKFQVVEVCRLFRMPPHKLADLDRATFANIEHLAIEYVVHTLNPWIERWKRAVHRCLLTTDEQLADQIYAEHDVSMLLRGDFTTQSEGFRKLLEKGVYSINEVRRWLNLNPIEGGDTHFVQLNLGTVQDVASGMTLEKPNPMPVQPPTRQNGANQ